MIMKTTKKTMRKSAADVKAEMSEQAEQAVDKQCADELEVILKKYDRALFPFIQHMEAASVARVRLVRAKPTPEAESEPAA